MMYLFYVMAQCNDIFGCITPPVNGQGNDPVQSVGGLFTFLIRAVISIAALVTLVYMLWGGFDWVTSNGEKEKIQKAQMKITYAVIGIIFIILSFSIFGVVAGNMLGIVQIKGGSIIFNVPTVAP